MPGAILLNDEELIDELLKLLVEKLMELDEEGNDVEKELEDDDAELVAFTPTTSMANMGDVAV